LSFLDLIFPKTCINCDRTGSYLCFDCVNYLKINQTNICPWCQKPSQQGKTHNCCKKHTSLSGLTSVFLLNLLLKKAFFKLKQKGVTDLKQTLVELVMTFLADHKGFENFFKTKDTFLIPLTQDKKKINKQGFDQAKLLGEDIAKSLGIGYFPNLSSFEKTFSSQKKKVLTNNFLKQKRVLFFNDLWERKRFLKQTENLKNLGFKNIWGLTLARSKNLDFN
jgi:predicted amidophosphoribosyltransferase